MSSSATRPGCSRLEDHPYLGNLVTDSVADKNHLTRPPAVRRRQHDSAGYRDGINRGARNLPSKPTQSVDRPVPIVSKPAALLTPSSTTRRPLLLPRAGGHAGETNKQEDSQGYARTCIWIIFESWQVNLWRTWSFHIFADHFVRINREVTAPPPCHWPDHS